MKVYQPSEHHIYCKKFVKKKGKYPDYIHSQINLVDTNKYGGVQFHADLHAPAGNVKGDLAKIKLYNDLQIRLSLMHEQGLWDLTKEDVKIVSRMYHWILIDSMSRNTKDFELIEQYKEVLKKNI